MLLKGSSGSITLSNMLTGTILSKSMYIMRNVQLDIMVNQTSHSLDTSLGMTALHLEKLVYELAEVGQAAVALYSLFKQEVNSSSRMNIE